MFKTRLETRTKETEPYVNITDTKLLYVMKVKFTTGSLFFTVDRN
jgi:hypothetical protein